MGRGSGGPGARPAGALVVLLFLVPLTGCLGGAGDSAVEVAVPRVGDTVSYAVQGDPASPREVHGVVRGLAERLDGALRAHQVVLIEWTLTSANGSLVFEEAVDPASGALVQEVALCGRVAGLRTLAEPGPCFDERALVLFTGSGLSAALGVAPLWGQALATASTTFELSDARTGAVQQAEASVRLGDGLAPQCRQVRWHVGDPWAPTLPVTAPRGPLVVCPDVPFPVSVTTVTGVELHLVAYERGTKDLPVLRSQIPGEKPAPPVPMRPIAAPLLVEDPSDPANFSVREAHEQALELSDAYRALFRSPGALLFGTKYRVSGYGELQGVGVFQNTERWMMAVNASGAVVDLVIKRRVDWGLVPEYELLEEGTDTWTAPVTMASLAPRQALLRDALELGSRLTGQPIDKGFGWSLRPYMAVPGLYGEVLERTDGYAVWTWYEDPANEVSGVRFGYHFALDGPTGTVLWVQLDRSRLPLTHP